MDRASDVLFFDDEHRIFRQQLRRIVQRELAPYVDEWEAAGTFDRGVYGTLASAGVLGAGFDEAVGGTGGDLFHRLLVAEELTRSGSPGLAASLGSLVIALPPILSAADSGQIDRFVRPVLAGEAIAALAVTEPGAGSDVANLRTRAVRDGEHWVISGQKTFITSGTRADVLTVAVRTGGEGAGGVSLFVVEGHRPGLRVGRTLDKMGWHASDTAELFFDDVRVPAANLVGDEGGGFGLLMTNFETERLLLAVTACEIARMAWEAAVDWSRQREAFGRPIGRFQVNRHKLAEMATQVQAASTFAWSVAARSRLGRATMGDAAMAKNVATDTCSRVVDDAVQLHGGHGFMRGTLVERLYRDARLYPIGGGTREIMNELIARFIGV